LRKSGNEKSQLMDGTGKKGLERGGLGQLGREEKIFRGRQTTGKKKRRREEW